MRNFILIFFGTLVMASCFAVSRSPSVEQSSAVATTLADIGTTLAWVGGISAGAGVALSLISLALPQLAPFAAIFRFAAIGGAGVTGTGAATIWLSDNLWTLALGVTASLGCVVWWYWPGIRRAFTRRLKDSA